MLKNIFLLLITMMILSCGQQQSPIGLKELWSTEKVLKKPESVIYDSQNDVLYVSNINKGGWEKDGDGFISKLSVDGKIVEMEWVSGLSNPKGMGIYKGKLYVADCDEVVEIEISSGEVINHYFSSEAKTLNDIDINQETGKLYVSDSGKGLVYTIENKNLILWKNVDKQNKINGLYALSDGLLVGGDRVTKINYNTGEQKEIISQTGNIDGIEWFKVDKYIISDWKGTIQLISTSSSPVVLLDTKPDSINAADIEYIAEKKMVLVPTFYDNRVVAYIIK